MNHRWKGTNSDFNFCVRWRYAFVPAGTVAVSSPDLIYLDVGGGYGPGMIDHHQGGTEACSATRLLLRRPDFVFDHLVPAWRSASRLRTSQGAPLEVEPTIVLHGQPDFDALASAHLAVHLVEHGGFPDYAEELASYADRVDQGLERLGLGPDASKPTLYSMLLALMNSKAAGDEAKRLHGEEGLLRFGLGLIEQWAASAEAGQRPSADTVIRFRDPGSLIAGLPPELAADLKKFHELLKAGHILELGEVPLPIRGDSAKCRPVRGAAVPEVHDHWQHRFLLRAGDDARPPSPLTVIARKQGTDASAAQLGRRKFTIAVDPSVRDITLEGLGAALEVAESRARELLGLEAVSERRGVARYEEFPGLADPWYDGRGHQHTIVESPKCGTVLSYQDIVKVLTSAFWEPEVASAMVARLEVSGQFVGCVGLPTHGRLDAWREIVAQLRDGMAGASLSVLFVRGEIQSGWGPVPTQRFAEFVCGGKPTRLWVAGDDCFVGALGVLLLAPEGKQEEPLLLKQLARVMRLASFISQVDKSLSNRNARNESGASVSRGLLRSHAEEVARFHAERSEGLTVDVLVVVQEIERRLDLEARIVGLGRLLEQLHEDSERTLAARLNRIVFFIGMFGLLQTAATIWPDESGHLGMMGWLFLGLVLVTCLAFVPFVARGLSRIPVLGNTLFDDVARSKKILRIPR